MASNKNYEIDLLSVVVVEMEAPSFEQILKIAAHDAAPAKVFSMLSFS